MKTMHITTEELQHAFHEKKCIILNSRYCCELEDTDFSACKFDSNCPRQTCQAKVKIFDVTEGRMLESGKICICYDLDLGLNGLHTAMLHFEDNGIKKSVTVCSCQTTERMKRDDN